MPGLFKAIIFAFLGILILLRPGRIFAQDSTYIKVQFIYGSKPLKNFRDTEKKWFGGLAGGHVGIEGDNNLVFDFHHEKAFHLFESNSNRHSCFLLRPLNEFWTGFGTPEHEIKKGTVIIPVSKAQKERFDSIRNSYLAQTPYDYAFLGMRCAAATYDILGQLGIVERYPRRTTYLKIFYPKLLRQKLYAKAKENGWVIIKQEGSTMRRWEQD